MKKFIISACLLSFISFSAYAEKEKTRDQREIEMAENAVFWSLVSKDASADNQAELGLIILGIKNSPRALKHLVKLMRYRIDAGLSENYTCYTLDKSKEILAYLKNVTPDELVKQCQLEFEIHKQHNPRLFEKIQPSDICSNQTQIKDRTQFLIEGILSEQHCVTEDF